MPRSHKYSFINGVSILFDDPYYLLGRSFVKLGIIPDNTAVWSGSYRYKKIKKWMLDYREEDIYDPF